MSRGFSVALMGMDGAGKSSLVASLTGTLQGAGLEVARISWRSAITGMDLPRGYPRTSLEQLWVEAWRLLYAGAAAGGVPVDESMPRTYADFTAERVEERLPRQPTGTRPSGMVVSSLIELVTDYILQAEIVRPALARGAVSLSEGFVFKNALKVIRLVQRMPDNDLPEATLEGLAAWARTLCSDPYLQPDVGILLDADAELAYRWRVAQSGRVNPAEDLSFARRSGREAFVEFQSAVGRELLEAATAWGWAVLPIDGRSAARTAAEALQVLLDSGRLEGMVPPHRLRDLELAAR